MSTTANSSHTDAEIASSPETPTAVDGTAPPTDPVGSPPEPGAGATAAETAAGEPEAADAVAVEPKLAATAAEAVVDEPPAEAEGIATELAPPGAGAESAEPAAESAGGTEPTGAEPVGSGPAAPDVIAPIATNLSAGAPSLDAPIDAARLEPGASPKPGTPATEAYAAAPKRPDPPPTSSIPRSAPPPKPSPWPARGRAALAVVHVFAQGFAWVWTRPKVRLALIGIVLLIIGIVFATSSVWTLPLIIVGALMVVVAWVGSRLDGRFAIDWGEGGTQLEFRAKIKSPAPVAALGAGSPASAESAEPADAEVIEGEAHTVEIDVNELKALIAAVEAEEARLHGSAGGSAIHGTTQAPIHSPADARPAGEDVRAHGGGLS